MYVQSFKRYEKKYLLTEEQFRAFTEKTSDIICPDSYGLHTIRNIYLDTDDFTLIRRSLERPVYKEKLRIRSYCAPEEDTEVFFELKKKYEGVVYKRRISLRVSELKAYLLSRERPASLVRTGDIQIFNEIDHLMKRMSPMPKVCLSYDRQAFFGREDREFRITFDSNIRSRTDDLTLADDRGELLDTGVENYRLMEVKTTGAVPLNTARIMSELKIYPVSLSKYGEVYKKMQSERSSALC